jgi:Putative MetA-pathway of phenol degradation
VTVAKTVLLLTLLAAPAVWAGPPFVTDDTETPPLHNWEINVPFIIQREHHETDMDAPLFDINYGALSNVQLELDIPVEVVQKPNDSTVAGPGDLLLGVKWRFIEEKDLRPQLAVYPQVELPTGNQQRGLGDGKVAYILPLLAEKNWDKWTAYGNAAYVVQTAGAPNYWYTGASINREINKRLSLGGELFGNSPIRSKEPSDLAFNLGGQWSLSEHLNLLFSAGRDILGDTKFMAYLGIQILIGDSKE